jgi:TolB-like protein
VNGAAAANGTKAVATPAVQAEPMPAPPRAAQRGWVLGALLAAGAAAAAVVAWAPGTAPTAAVRVAVLPFTADASDPNGAQLAQRLTESVTAELVRGDRFSVVASSAARAEYSATRRPRDIGAALDADVLIQARIRPDGDRIRVETFAVAGDAEEKLWVLGFAGSTADSDTLAREIADAVTDALGTAGAKN